MKPQKESKFQNSLIADLKKRFSGCIVFKTDPTYIQGFPDLIMLYDEFWVAFECKRDISAPLRSNQAFYVNKLNAMSHAYFVYPENKEAVLNELQRAFEAERASRVSQP